VKDKFPDDGWLEMDGNPKEWAVAFHGVREPTGYACSKIMLEGEKVGPNQVCEVNKCQRTG